jgi:hypothetical protein
MTISNQEPGSARGAGRLPRFMSVRYTQVWRVRLAVWRPSATSRSPGTRDRRDAEDASEVRERWTVAFLVQGAPGGRAAPPRHCVPYMPARHRAAAEHPAWAEPGTQMNKPPIDGGPMMQLAVSSATLGGTRISTRQLPRSSPGNDKIIAHASPTRASMRPLTHPTARDCAAPGHAGLLMATLLASGRGTDPAPAAACLEDRLDCTPAYVPTYDAIFADVCSVAVRRHGRKLPLRPRPHTGQGSLLPRT